MKVWHSAKSGWRSHTWGPRESPIPLGCRVVTLVRSEISHTTLGAGAGRIVGELDCSPLALRYITHRQFPQREYSWLRIEEGDVVALFDDGSACVVDHVPTQAGWLEWVQAERRQELIPGLQVAMDQRTEQGMIPPCPGGWRAAEWEGRYGYTQANWYTGKSIGGLIDIPGKRLQCLLADHPDQRLGHLYHPAFGWCDGDRRFRPLSTPWWGMPHQLRSRLWEGPGVHPEDSDPRIPLSEAELGNPTLFVARSGTGGFGVLQNWLYQQGQGVFPYHFVWVDVQEKRLLTPVSGGAIPAPAEVWQQVLASVGL
jgi:hypothetical protein